MTAPDIRHITRACGDGCRFPACRCPLPASVGAIPPDVVRAMALAQQELRT